MTTNTYRLVQNHRANADCGAVRTIDVETLTAVDGGIRVDTHITGTVEGTRIDRRVTAFYPGVTMDKAHAYRMAHGYTLVSAS